MVGSALLKDKLSIAGLTEAKPFRDDDGYYGISLKIASTTDDCSMEIAVYEEDLNRMFRAIEDRRHYLTRDSRF